jgi:hypothetical protein
MRRLRYRVCCSFVAGDCLAAFAKVTETDFGKTKDGVGKSFEVTNKNGMKVRLLSRGATLIGVTPDRDEAR